MTRLATYLKTLRRQHGLTQKELAFLCGMDGGTQMSRYERCVRDPSLAAFIALTIVFSTTPAELFPGLHSEISRMVLERAEELYVQLQGNPKSVTPVKLDFLEHLIYPPQNTDHPIV
ncbi:MAG: helix-turn-helix transcriptional regulator [Rhizobiales bacterium]|nr:helix-turn-helix transcriptional regulator [Hyphomicrobiales bacterium]